MVLLVTTVFQPPGQNPHQPHHRPTQIPSIMEGIPNSWALVPGLDHAPDGLIRLGIIFVNPSEPHLPLTTVTTAELEAQYPEVWRRSSWGLLYMRD